MKIRRRIYTFFDWVILLTPSTNGYTATVETSSDSNSYAPARIVGEFPSELAAKHAAEDYLMRQGARHALSDALLELWEDSRVFEHSQQGVEEFKRLVDSVEDQSFNREDQL